MLSTIHKSEDIIYFQTVTILSQHYSVFRHLQIRKNKMIAFENKLKNYCTTNVGDSDMHLLLWLAYNQCELVGKMRF